MELNVWRAIHRKGPIKIFYVPVLSNRRLAAPDKNFAVIGYRPAWRQACRPPSALAIPPMFGPLLWLLYAMRASLLGGALVRSRAGGYPIENSCRLCAVVD